MEELWLAHIHLLDDGDLYYRCPSLEAATENVKQYVLGQWDNEIDEAPDDPMSVDDMKYYFLTTGEWANVVHFGKHDQGGYVEVIRPAIANRDSNAEGEDD